MRTPHILTTIVAVALAGKAIAAEVNVYSARQDSLIVPLLDRFTKKAGIEVNLITGTANALLSRIQAEGAATPADVLVTVDAGNLHRAKEAGVLAAVNSSTLAEKIPANLRDMDNQWFGLTIRSRPIFYAKDRVNPSELSTYEALTDSQWNKRICIRSSSNIYNQSLVASMIEANGADATLQWAEGLVSNLARKPAGGDTDQLRAAASGQCDLAIANTYYFGRLIDSKKPEDREVVQKLGVFWPNQTDRGAHINVSGMGVTRNAKNRAEAIQLLEFMVSEDAQAYYAEINHEYPVVQGVAPSPTIAALGEFRSDALNLSTLGVNNRDAVKLMDRAGWQ
jgi:iron(III) transport system substrate-binding protein